MGGIYERQKDILSIIQGLDISPALYHNAVEKYQALEKCLNDSGLKAEIYPQGSIAFGTVVRPSAKDSSASYDFDFICQVMGSWNDYTIQELRGKVEIIGVLIVDYYHLCQKRIEQSTVFRLPFNQVGLN